MIYTIQNMKDSISGHGTTSQQLLTDADDEILKRVAERMANRLNAMTDERVVNLFNKQNGFKMRVFAPGMYFISNNIQKYSCQI